jgi:hypothetical protein
LAARATIELDAFANYHRDAHLNLSEVERTGPQAWRQLTEAFTAAGVDIETAAAPGARQQPPRRAERRSRHRR